MANYNQVSYGSQGSSVTELQKLLNNNGYNLTVDGIFGSNTQAAVKDYQQKNGLAVDGIVGTNTWGALTKVANSTASTPAASAPATSAETAETTTPTTPPAAEETSTGYKPSDAVTQAEQLLNQQLSQKPGEYQSSWQEQLNETLQQILNREKFSYDMNADALYQQYKDQYTAKGQMAMMDTMGQAAAMTGGYGNSYAQSAGQQAYQGHLQDLNNKIPELYQLALNKYQMEEDSLYNQAALMAQQEEMDYGRYRDQVGDWQTERDYLTGRYDTERDYDYGMWADNRDYEYQVGRDKVSDEQWQAEFDEAKRQFDQQYALKTTSSGGGSSGGSSSSKSSSSSSSSYNSETAQIQQMLRNAGYNIAVDGIWGPETQKAYDAYNGKPASTVPTTYAELSRFLSSGNYTKGEISVLITDALADGIINQNQAQQLRNAYIPKAQTTKN